MRLTVFLALAIASICLAGLAGLAAAETTTTIPGISGLPSFSGISDLASGTNFGYPNLGSSQTSAAVPPDLMNWLNSSDNTDSLPDMGGSVPAALLTGQDITDGMPIGTTGATTYVPDMATQSLGIDATITGILAKYGF